MKVSVKMLASVSLEVPPTGEKALSGRSALHGGAGSEAVMSVKLTPPRPWCEHPSYR